MSRLDLVYVARKPARLIHHYGFHVVVSLALLGTAVASRHDVFTQTPAYTAWPFMLAGVGLAVAVSVFVPLESRFHALVGASIAGLAALRITTYLLAITSGDLTGSGVVIASYLICLWSLVAAIGVAWDRVALSVGLRVTVEAGEDAV